ncbi:hypothetical protein HHX47_DHR5000775 [Lentinula edodes]|nr:hypothetical protein HHX47_DHR5000775 [Lentinula edodes]
MHLNLLLSIKIQHCATLNCQLIIHSKSCVTEYCSHCCTAKPELTCPFHHKVPKPGSLEPATPSLLQDPTAFPAKRISQPMDPIFTLKFKIDHTIQDEKREAEERKRAIKTNQLETVEIIFWYKVQQINQ